MNSMKCRDECEISCNAMKIVCVCVYICAVQFMQRVRDRFEYTDRLRLDHLLCVITIHEISFSIQTRGRGKRQRQAKRDHK